MAKNLIKGAYGKAPDRSYLAGCSNGGRHAMVGASRYAALDDGTPYGKDLAAEVAELCAALEACPAEVILVSNEVGLSIVPENAMARRFRDEQGRANQELAALASAVYFITAGLPLKL